MDDYPLLNLFLTMLYFFLWVMWFFLLFKVIMDLFRDHSLSGWGKAAWLIAVLACPTSAFSSTSSCGGGACGTGTSPRRRNRRRRSVRT